MPPIHVAEPASGDSQPITQAELENCLAVSADLERLRAVHDRLAESILQRHHDGAALEPGRRTYEVARSFRGSKCTETLVVR